MRTFKDLQRQEWKINITLASAVRLKNEAAFDIKDIAEDPKTLTRLTTDFMMLAGVFWVLLSDQAGELGLTEDETMKRIAGGDVLENAIDSLVAECFDFFPRQKRSALRHSLERVKELEIAATQQAVNQVDKIIDSQMQKIANGSVLDTNLEELLGSMPASTP